MEVGVDADRFRGVEADGVEGGMAEAGGGAGGGQLLELLLEDRGGRLDGGLGGEDDGDSKQGCDREKGAALGGGGEGTHG